MINATSGSQTYMLFAKKDVFTLECIGSLINIACLTY